VHRQNEPRPPNDGGAHTPDVRTPTAPRTRFSEVWRRYLRIASLPAVGGRLPRIGSAMPCASWERNVGGRGIWKFRRGHSIPELPALLQAGDCLPNRGK